MDISAITLSRFSLTPGLGGKRNAHYGGGGGGVLVNGEERRGEERVPGTQSMMDRVTEEEELMSEPLAPASSFCRSKLNHDDFDYQYIIIGVIGSSAWPWSCQVC